MHTAIKHKSILIVGVLPLHQEQLDDYWPVFQVGQIQQSTCTFLSLTLCSCYQTTFVIHMVASRLKLVVHT